jgi:hypothetical protein
MNAVAIMTPDAKNFATKKAHEGNRFLPGDFGSLLAQTGNTAAIVEPTKITKTAEIRSPNRPSYSLPSSQARDWGGSCSTSRLTSNWASGSILDLLQRAGQTPRKHGLSLENEKTKRPIKQPIGKREVKRMRPEGKKKKKGKIK